MSRQKIWNLPCIALLMLSANCIAYQDLKTPKRASNTILGMNATCTPDFLDVTVLMELPFTGVVYARGFPLECRGMGTGAKEVRLRLSTALCGVQLHLEQDGRVICRAVIDVQLDKHLQQIADQQRRVACAQTQRTRNGRKMAGRQGDDKMSRHLEDERAWLEIRGLDYPDGSANQVSVGEMTTLIVKSRLPDGVDSRVVDCSAHDGAGDLTQSLLDGEGCSVDDVILPAMVYTRPARGEHSGGGLHTASAEFPAFKFPDRNSLHVRCVLQLCRGACAWRSCNTTANSTAGRRHRTLKGNPGEVLNRLVVYNSVEVLAPGIDTDDEASNQYPRARAEFDSASVPLLQGDRAVCLSPSKMALAFGILGVVFLAAVAVALCMLLGRRRTTRVKHRLLRDDAFLVHDSHSMMGLHQPNCSPFVRVFH